MNQTIRVYNESQGYEQIPAVVVSTGLGGVITGGIPAQAKFATIQPEGGDVRYRTDGVAPTAALGMILFDGQMLEYYGKLSDIHFIDASAAAKLNVEYFKTR